jgi:thioredoxin reductase (NADPH)
VVAIAGGLGSFEPRKPLIELISMKIRESSISSKIQKNLEKKSGHRGWRRFRFRLEYFLTDVASEVTIRRNEFRGALDSVEKVQIKDAGKIRMITS